MAKKTRILASNQAHMAALRSLLPSGYTLVGPGRVSFTRRQLINALHARNQKYEASGCYHRDPARGDRVTERIVQCEHQANSILAYLKDQASKPRLSVRRKVETRVTQLHAAGRNR